MHVAGCVAGWLATGALAAPGTVEEPAPLCRVHAEVAPAVAFVGEPVLQRVRITTHPDVLRASWIDAPSFPDHRAEPLSPGAAIDSTAPDDTTWRTREERRMLFAARPGLLEIPAATLLCVAGHGEPSRRHEVRLAPLRVEARPVPAAGRPADFDGLIGPVAWQRAVDRRQLVLGESVGLTLRVSGPGNVWAARLEPPSPPEEAPGDFETFSTGEHIHAVRGERLVTRRTARFDVVPRRAGRVVLPAQSLTWLDPATGRYETRTAPAIDLEVRRPSADSHADAAADTSGPRARMPGDEPSSPRAAEAIGDAWPGVREDGLLDTVLAAAALALLSFAAGWLLFRVRRGHRALDAALQAADAARTAGDRRREAEALERALRAALARRSPALAGLAPPELAWRGAGDEALEEAARLLGDLEEARFGGQPRAPDHAAVRAWIEGAIR